MWLGASASGLLLSLAYASKELPGLDREWENDGRAFLAGNNPKCTKIAQLHRLGPLGEDLSGFEQFLRRLLLSFGINDLGASLTLGLGR